MMTRRTMLTALPATGLLRGQQNQAAAEITHVRIDAGGKLQRASTP